MNSIDERGSLTTVSYSSEESKGRGTLVSTVTAQPDSFGWDGKSINIIDAWIERMSQVHYQFLFFKRREYFDKHVLVVRFNDSADNAPDFVLTSNLKFPFMEQTNGENYVKSLYLGEKYSDSLIVAVKNNGVMIDTIRFDLK
jgi:hypothetical protein